MEGATATITDRPLLSSYYDRALIADDTEESVSGADWHLQAIVALYDALYRHKDQRHRLWYVTAEVLILADLPERAKNPWRSMPDVYVATGVPGDQRVSYDLRAGLPFPRFVCEVVSKDTWRKDIGEKQRLYADLGAEEYIVFDPTGEFPRQPLRAWRREGNDWVRWHPDGERFLASAVLGLRLRVEGPLLRLYEGRERVPTSGELAEALAARDAELVEERANSAALRAELAHFQVQVRPSDSTE